jgi:hypothetical protein
MSMRVRQKSDGEQYENERHCQDGYCIFAYSDLASFRMRMLGPFQRARTLHHVLRFGLWQERDISAGNNLRATKRPSSVSSALYTTPIPPPSFSTMR